ncbi:hypothetical protein [Sphingomonas sp.]|uniref:hypothetical protein n=1 Tax=Sphingomonas sp. TaxID=28214 RepID=UPI002B6BB6F2|nr:hypothetical protein [Sphingomonas sp.]HWK34899.1 hypothetical protein [Sphingomonas sp.]
MTRPPSIVRFEQFYLGYWLVGIANTALSWRTTLASAMANPDVAALGAVFLYAMTAMGFVIPLLLWFFIARRGSTIAKWILVVLFAIGLLGIALMLVRGTFPSGVSGVLAALAIVLQAAAVAMLFRSDTRPWFGEVDPLDEELVTGEPGA